ncbi:hypothetical protein C8Q80DRAFT_918213 [Daedaleopsis nitida]|nr:hypothetical protein C8Q80DRAFT_918213 [Daedaleopsis nitida]
MPLPAFSQVTPLTWLDAVPADLDNMSNDHVDGQHSSRPGVLPNNDLLANTRIFFEYGEHQLIGDSMELTLLNGQRVLAQSYPFTLTNGLKLTYGQINGLAGDFYSTDRPISDGHTARDQSDRFLAAYNTLAASKPSDVCGVLGALQPEVDAVEDALRRHRNPSNAYNALSALTPVRLLWKTISVFGSRKCPNYISLSHINWDHFGPDARIAYNTGHAVALRAAAKGDLEEAYTLNAFADHFLEDSFSAGHLRTPRRALHKGWYDADVCAKYMHDEDNAIGISVRNPAGDSWTCWGDQHTLDDVAADNLKHCQAAIQASVDEVYKAYHTGQIPPPESYTAWTIAPTLESANAPQWLAPLFRCQDGVLQRRKDLADRRRHDYTTDFWFSATASKCFFGQSWKYPIAMNTPPHAIPCTSLAVTVPNQSRRGTRLYYLNPQHEVVQDYFNGQKWSRAVLFAAAPLTPLASISWDDGNEIRVYYINEDFKLRERCYSTSRSSWYEGELNELNIHAAEDTSIAAVCFSDGDLFIRVYCQESHSDQIQEFCNDGRKWRRGPAAFPNALSGSAISAVVYKAEGWRERLYCQSTDMSIQEYCFDEDEGGWYRGDVDLGKTSACYPISALYDNSGDSGAPSVYWMNSAQEICHSMRVDGKWTLSKVVGPLVNGTKFAAAQLDTIGSVGVYYQAADTSVKEVCKDGSDKQWHAGATVP